MNFRSAQTIDVTRRRRILSVDRDQPIPWIDGTPDVQQEEIGRSDHDGRPSQALSDTQFALGQVNHGEIGSRVRRSSFDRSAGTSEVLRGHEKAESLRRIGADADRAQRAPGGVSSECVGRGRDDSGNPPR